MNTTSQKTAIEELALPGVCGLRPYEPGKPVDELERELGLTNIIKLASNENPLGVSQKVIAAITAALSELSRYPDGNGFALKQVLADKHGVTTQQVTLGNGSNDILELLTRAFVSPDNEVVFSEHAFAVYPIVTQAVGAKAVVVPATEWGNDLEAILAAITDKTRVVFVANPNNPTGTCVAGDSLKSFIKRVPEHVLVVIDEAYFEYAQDLFPDYESAEEYLAESPNLIVTRTFSKAYGLAALRMGYSLSSVEIADFLNRVRQPFNVNSLAMTAAITALSDTQHLADTLEMNKAGIEQYHQACIELGLEWIPTAANFISINVKQNGREVFEKLLQRGIIVRPVDNYGMPDFIRITVGSKEENQRCIEALMEVLQT
ncbi:MAG: histidinol-phosphate transaminase [Sulfuriflexus sp.]|nr:histidinol-phosphate transaminase [Sulfuriflexus sp.]